MILRQVYVKTMFVFGTYLDNRFSPFWNNVSHTYSAIHDSSMYGDQYIGKTQRPCVPYAKKDFMFNVENMMGVEGNYTTPEGERAASSR